jgi:glycerol transport system substrate-binding protein
MKSTPEDRAKAAWLYAQFVTSKTVSLKKSHVGLTIIRDSDIRHESFTERAAELGGLVEFYRSPARVQWTPTGTNVPDYPRLAQLWWQNIGDASSGAKTPQEAMTALAVAQERLMQRLQRANVLGECGPLLNEPQSRDYWLSQPGAPKAKLDNEKPAPVTIDYDELVKSWQ